MAVALGATVMSCVFAPPAFADAAAAAADRWAKSRGADKLRADRDFAVSWTRRYGAGRVFYTSFGHDKRAFIDKPRLLHMLAGLQYCLGDLDCPDSPSSDRRNVQ